MAGQVMMVRWVHPELDWVKLNTDGSCRGEKIACGGVLRNGYGSWLLGFSSNTGIGSPLTAELWGVLMGLDLAWQHGYRKIWVELDSKIALQLIKDGCDVSHPEVGLVDGIRDFFNWDWEIVCSHTYREGNRVADQLAKFGHTISKFLDTEFFDNPPQECEDFVLEDKAGVFVRRYMKV